MGLFNWNERKSARIAELENENQELRVARDSLLADNKVLEETCDELRSDNKVLRERGDELISENKSLHNVGMGYRESAERLAKERDDLKKRLEDRTKQVVFLKIHIANLEQGIMAAYAAIQKRDWPTKELNEIDERDSE
jgi:uncharacterized protein (DUF3084 family)